MNYHIVRTNDTIESIALIYNFSVEEIKSINNHIRNWMKLIPGTKLRLPEIPEIINNELTDIEPFIEDYYPKLNYESIKSTNEDETIIPVDLMTEESLEKNSPKQDEKMKKSNTLKVNPYYQYYPYYQYGYGYQVYPYQFYPLPNSNYQRSQKPNQKKQRPS